MRHFGVAGGFTLAAAIFLLPPGVSPASDEAGAGLESRSQRPYVHRIDLYDKEGRYIDPTARNAAVFSNDATCGKCHDVEAVSGGWHFNHADPSVDAGRRGEPWFLVDESSGTQIPISYRGWEGTWKPEAVGMQAADFLLLFGRHLPGGGIGEARHRGEDGDERWARMGDFGIDCMICHSVSSHDDPARRAEQVAAGNFEYVSVVGMGLGSVKGSALEEPKASAKADPFADFDPANEESVVAAAVEFIYNASRLDADKRVLFELVREIPNENCFTCHSSHVGQSSDGLMTWQRAGDVHVDSGMACVDCHRNGIDHRMVRGFEGEKTSVLTHQEAFTCRGCHLGTGASHAMEVTQTAGGLGSPVPGHHGIPLIHFQTMACTSCHSGPLPDADRTIVQTSMGHGLGLPRFGRRAVELPIIVEPIFLPDQTGKLAPHRMVWPSFYGRLGEDEKVVPLPPSALPLRSDSSKPPTQSGVTREGVVAMLRALAERGDADCVYVANGFLHRLAEDGELMEERHTAAEPYAWPLAHDVRPGAQSLGARGCQECHSPEAPFLFSKLRVPLVLERPLPVEIASAEIAGLDEAAQERFARTFALRPLYKVVGFASLAVIGLVLASAGGAWVMSGRRWR
jgi:nitrate/TMAO reductase-like tetraheme cytochrome c subunit